MRLLAVVVAVNVAACGSDWDAARGFDKKAEIIQLVLTDIVMPGTDGPSMVARMRSRMPGVRVLFMSGYSDHPALNGTALTQGDALLAKPFTIEGLASAVRCALAEGDAPQSAAARPSS